MYIHPQNFTEKSIFSLTPIDCLQGAVPPIAFSLFYDETINVAKLKESLEKTLVYFPYLAGRIHRTTNRKQAAFQIHVHPSRGGALFTTTRISKPYSNHNDRRWFPIFTGDPFPAPHEPNITYGPLLKVKVTQVSSTNATVISFGFCHAVMDATSVGAFLETLQAHYDSKHSTSPLSPPKMSSQRVTCDKNNDQQEPLDRFQPCEVLQAIPKILARHQVINLTVERSELQRLKDEFITALDGALEWTSTYEVLGVVLLRAYSQTSPVKELECRCYVDPRNREASPTNATHPGNVMELPSIRYSHHSSDAWKQPSLVDFHTQLRTALEDPKQMTELMRRAQASYDRGYLHSLEGRVRSSKIYARNFTEPGVCIYNSWLYMDWLELCRLGGVQPNHLEVSPGLNMPNIFWVFPRTPTQVTIRTTLKPGQAERFLEALKQMNVAFEVQ